MTSASSTGLKHGESQYSLGNPSHSSSTVAYGGPNSYALYREKTLKRQQSVREFHKAAENMAISQEAATQRETRYMEAPPSVNFSDLQLVGIEGLTRDSSRKSNRSVPSEMILDRGMNTSEVYTAPFHKNDQVLDVVKRNNSSSVIRSNGDDNNRKNLKHATSSERLQNPPLTRSRSKSTRYPWAQAGQAQLLSASVSSPALVSAPVQRPTNRNASVRRTKSNYSGSSRYNHHMEGMDDLSRTKQLSSRSRPSLESELASSISLPPQRPPIIPTRSPSRREQQDSARAGTVSQPIKLLDDKASHGLYGYL
ncbi:hypothetical protein BGZ46_009053 [Entomortierella lignicola]|nr:hypothetical protein BGZ46_009053 [Entomortierella lignicola]